MPIADQERIRKTVYRVLRTMKKYDHRATTRRFKRYKPYMRHELRWEFEILDRLEKAVFDKLEELGVPTDEWAYYQGFAKRLWVRAIAFIDATYGLEKTSLHNEYVLRGHDATVLDQLQPIAEEKAEEKLIFLMVFVDHMARGS